jgi:hypothetical protein
MVRFSPLEPNQLRLSPTSWIVTHGGAFLLSPHLTDLQLIPPLLVSPSDSIQNELTPAGNIAAPAVAATAPTAIESNAIVAADFKIEYRDFLVPSSTSASSENQTFPG